MPMYAISRGDGFVLETLTIPAAEKPLYERRLVEVTAVVNGLTHYDDGANVLPRPPSPVTWTDASESNGGALLDVPAGAIVRIDGEGVVSLEGGREDLEFPMPGTYRVMVEAFPYLDFETAVTIDL